ncbi:MAG: hypothetical protein JWO26_1126 [Rhodospirillales bacterium]|nr:hypothetical protein [Rhodospirillales bacterium]
MASAGVYSLGLKLVGLLAGIASYDPAAEFILAAILGWFVVLGARRFHIRLHTGMLVGAVACVALIILLPQTLGMQAKWRCGLAHWR